MVLDALFGFLLAYNPAIAVTIYSFIVLVLINIFYRILINQNDAKQLKEKTKELNKQMKEAQKTGNKDEVNKAMSEVMRENSKLMRMTMKPMIISFIIVILLLPWMADSYGDRIVALGNSTGEMNYQGTKYQIEKTDNGVIVKTATQSISCTFPCTEKIDKNLFEISKQDTNAKFMPVVALLPISLPFIGNVLGWLGWYILVSIPLVILIRKFMKIYV